MAGKLKTYQTSIGFFDLAIAAPSMKAALQAWGADSNLFHQGFASETDDANIVAAAMQRPGVVLRRPVGSAGAFKEQADLPRDLPSRTNKPRIAAKPAKSIKQPASKADEKAAKRAALAYEKENQKRAAIDRKQKAAEAKARQRRDAAVASAHAALEKASREHEQRTGDLEAERDALTQQIEAEDARWHKQKERLTAALRDAKSG